MYALFLETKAAEQITDWALTNDYTEEGLEDLLRRAYSNISKQRPWQTDEWWVNMCLKDDSHKRFTLSSSFSWSSTPEGHKFWLNINVGVII